MTRNALDDLRREERGHFVAHLFYMAKELEEAGHVIRDLTHRVKGHEVHEDDAAEAVVERLADLGQSLAPHKLIRSVAMLERVNGALQATEDRTAHRRS